MLINTLPVETIFYGASTRQFFNVLVSLNVLRYQNLAEYYNTMLC